MVPWSRLADVSCGMRVKYKRAVPAAEGLKSMPIHEHLPPQAGRELKEVGLARVGVGDSGPKRQAKVRLCNLAAPGAHCQKIISSGTGRGN